jgi:hypothetical protein
LPVVASGEQLFLVIEAPLRRTIQVAVDVTVTLSGIALRLEMD